MDIHTARNYIDMAAGEARDRYISSGVGQESTYLLKAQHANAYKAAGYTGDVPLFIQSEISATGETPQEATDSILLQEAQWIYLASQIETIRRTGKVGLDSLTDPVDIDNHCDSVVSMLNSI